MESSTAVVPSMRCNAFFVPSGPYGRRPSKRREYNPSNGLGWRSVCHVGAAATLSVFRMNGLDPKVQIAYEIPNASVRVSLGLLGPRRAGDILLSDCIGNRICQSISSRAVGKTPDWSQAGVDTQPITTSAARFRVISCAP